MRFVTILGKNLIEKEVKKMKKFIAITTIMLFVLSTAMPAGAAFTSDVKRVLSAEADLETGVPDYATMPMPVLKDKTTGSTVAGSTVTWTYDAAKTWKVANQYLYLSYQANRAGWGIQMYTDNMSATASPQWVETPANTSKPDAPAGLVGEGSVNYIAIPIAWKAFPGGTYGTPTYVTSVTTTTEFRTNYTEPLETAATLNPITHAYDKRLYQASSGSNLYGEYSWLVDKGSENWFDLDSDGEIDTGEIQDIFSNGSEGQTVVNYLGASTSTYAPPPNNYVYRDECVSPIYVVLAAKIAAGSIKAIYSTNTLTLELYHQ